jgi:hypothetical protein
VRSLIEKKVEDIDLEFFSQLHSGEILFVDSSHTVKIGGDVNYLFLEVLPRLKPGVIVHVYDIFLPFEYPRAWVMEEFRFWTEQYLLQAFLSFNSEFEVLMANSYISHRHKENLKAIFRVYSPGAEAVSGRAEGLESRPNRLSYKRSAPKACRRDRESCFAQVEREKINNVAFVLDNQNPSAGCCFHMSVSRTAAAHFQNRWCWFQILASE